MDIVQLFCDALHTTPKLENFKTAKIHKAEKQHLKYITELFDQLPYRVQRIAINESFKKSVNTERKDKGATRTCLRSDADHN